MPKELPEKGELVVCTVEKAKGFGAFVALEEHPGKRGFIHIKEVAPGWVKNIRDYVREGQRIVCKVMDIDVSKGYVDLSLKRVNDHQRRETIQTWKNEQKARKLLEMVAEKVGKNIDTCYEEFGNDLIAKYGSLYAALEEAAIDAQHLAEDGFAGEWLDAFVASAQENIAVPHVEIKGYVEMVCPLPDGVKHLKKALGLIEMADDDIEVRVRYLSAPLYRIEVRAPDYKLAEKELKTRIDASIAYIKKHGGDASFKRDLK
jgi:translation initiation factor 2 subunit 1